LQKFRKQLDTQVLPALTVNKVFEEAYQTTMKNFSQAGFFLTKWEATIIAKMMTLILLFASPTKLLELAAGHYNIKPILADDANLNNIFLPRWTSQFLNLMNREPRAIEHPIKSIFHFCYEGLLTDAVTHGFERIEYVLSESVGTKEERTSYCEQLLSDYNDKKLNFSSVYLPLILGGISAADMVVLQDDNMIDAAREIENMVDLRRSELLDDETAGIFDMTDRLMGKVLLKYGYNAKRM